MSTYSFSTGDRKSLHLSLISSYSSSRNALNPPTTPALPAISLSRSATNPRAHFGDPIAQRPQRQTSTDLQGTAVLGPGGLHRHCGLRAHHVVPEPVLQQASGTLLLILAYSGRGRRSFDVQDSRPNTTRARSTPPRRGGRRGRPSNTLGIDTFAFVVSVEGVRIPGVDDPSNSADMDVDVGSSSRSWRRPWAESGGAGGRLAETPDPIGSGLCLLQGARGRSAHRHHVRVLSCANRELHRSHPRR